MIIDGRKISKEILEQLKTEVASLGFVPKLIDVFVGDDPVIESYVKIKAKRAEEIGIAFETIRLPATISQVELEEKVAALNKETDLCDLIVQLPLPGNLNKQPVIDEIIPRFDVDMITSANLGVFFTGEEMIVPATANAILKMIQSVEPNLEGKHVLVIGAGYLVGKPVSILLMQNRATVTVANSATEDLKSLCLQADIIVSGTGVPGLITDDMVNPNTIVIDAGTAESYTGVIQGDVDFAKVEPKAKAVSPVPGGVGPVTVAMLLYNVVQVAKTLKKAH